MSRSRIPATSMRAERRGWFARAWGALRGRLFGIANDEARVERRGFTVKTLDIAAHLEAIGFSFIDAYNDAITASSLPPLIARLEAVSPEWRGFAYEGAAMGLTIRDAVCPGPSLWRAYVEGPALLHHYIAFVGRGWAFARLPGKIGWHIRKLAGPLRWLVFDGYGFHQGFFDWPRTVDACKPDHGLHGYALRAFDQGLGRSLWFVRGMDADAISDAISRFDATRHGDLWSGVGLAATYAGGIPPDALLDLAQASGAHLPSLVQGAVFAAEARHRAGIVTRHTEVATRLLCAMSVADAAHIALRAKPDETLPDPEGFHYEAWRRDIRQQFGPTHLHFSR